MIYEIKFEHGEQNLFAESEQAYQPKTTVIIRTKRGNSWGKVLRELKDLPSNYEAEGKILREADERDLKAIDRLEIDGQEAVKESRQLVAQRGLDMKIIHAAYNMEKTQLFISFTAEKRVDFRELLKDLAGNFRSRIELRQIGARDAVKLQGGMGPCGRPLCCSTFIYEFPNVSIKMAKNQQLSLKQNKLNGLCGRLMCCLTYEDDFYKEASRAFPDWGKRVKTAMGDGKVIGLNILGESVKVRLAERVQDFALSEIEVIHA
ncbi:regulatory iron-sulfur-containing complex subunit RicT [Lactococcus termiticola]|uniref:Signal peptidase n=1 Tax=Lactococcus termiticola TaxID=2169526 RepID=A0A2R5HF71_9LACT|nr:regulatory iron-sulfur-containing complex subunit RicT [Lactococcus termiticola]GBG96476.1 signal peptidase [Lactococcus termiticola]